MSATDPAVWFLVTSTTRSFADRTSETLVMRARLLDIAAKYRQCGIEHRAGHSFEVLHSWSFNLDAIRRRADVRADWVGPGNGPVDIEIVDGARRVLDAVQTKLMDDPAATAAQLRADRYAGQQRVVARDRAPDVRRYLAKGRRAFTDERIRAGYADAEANLADRVRFGDVESTPMTRSDVHAIAADPGRWGTARSLQAAGHQVGVAAATGAGLGALSGGGLEALTQFVRVRAGETTTADAAWSVAVAAGNGAARSGAVAGLGEAVRIAARCKLAGSAVPTAIATVVVDVAVSGIAYARGEVDATEFALRGGEVVLQTVLAGAFGAAGQAVLPGAGLWMGATAGQLAGTAVAGWVRAWVAGPDETDEAGGEPAAIEAVPAAEDLLVHVDAVIGEVSGWLAGLWTDAVTAVDEFDAWMTDTASTLLLDPNPA